MEKFVTIFSTLFSLAKRGGQRSADRVNAREATKRLSIGVSTHPEYASLFDPLCGSSKEGE